MLEHLTIATTCPRCGKSRPRLYKLHGQDETKMCGKCLGLAKYRQARARRLKRRAPEEMKVTEWISGVCSCCKEFKRVFLPRGILGQKFDQLCGKCYHVIAEARPKNEESPRAQGTNLRARGTNPTALGTNPRALGANPRANDLYTRGEGVKGRPRAGRPFLNLHSCRRCGGELASPLLYASCYLCGGPLSMTRIYS